MRQREMERTRRSEKSKKCLISSVLSSKNHSFFFSTDHIIMFKFFLFFYLREERTKVATTASPTMAVTPRATPTFAPKYPPSRSTQPQTTIDDLDLDLRSPIFFFLIWFPKRKKRNQIAMTCFDFGDLFNFEKDEGSAD